MSRFFSRVAARVFGAGPTLRPATNRYQVILADSANAPSVPRHAVAEPSVDGRGGPPRSSAPPAAPEAPREAVTALREAARVEPAEPRLLPAADGAVESSPRAERSAGHSIHEVPAEPIGRATSAPGAREVPAARVGGEIGQSNEPRLLPRSAAPAALPSQRPVAPLRPTRPGGREPAPVHVHIGRIDVRAVEAPAKPPVARSAPRAPSLAEHLRARDRSG